MKLPAELRELAQGQETVLNVGTAMMLREAADHIVRLESAITDISQAIWHDERGIQRIDVGCIKEAIEQCSAPQRK